HLWEAATGKTVCVLTGHQQTAPNRFANHLVSCVAWSPDGKTLASGSYDSTIRLWQTATGKQLFKLTGHRTVVNGVAWSPDGKVLASASGDDTVRLWETATGTEIRRLTGHGHWVYAVAWSPDGERLASGSWDGTALVWDVAGVRSLNKPDLSEDRLAALWSDLTADAP